MTRTAAAGLKIGAVLLILFLFFGGMQGARWAESRYRVRTSKAKADMRMLAAGLEKYRLTQHSYPAMAPMASLGLSEESLKAARAEGLSTIAPGWEKSIELTGSDGSPALLPNDAEDKTGKRPYAYWTGQARFLIFSAGPDGHFTIQHPESTLPGAGSDIETLDPRPLYDPSNGTVSEGDLVRFGGATDAASLAKIYDPSNGAIGEGEVIRVHD